MCGHVAKITLICCSLETGHAHTLWSLVPFGPKGTWVGPLCMGFVVTHHQDAQLDLDVRCLEAKS